MEALTRQVMESRDMLRMIADSVPALIAYIDKHERYVFCNAAYSEWFGVSVKNIRETSVADLFDDNTYQAMRPNIQKVLDGKKVEFEIQLRHRLKGTRINKTTLTPHINNSGEVVGYCVLSFDINTIKESEALSEKKAIELSRSMEKIEQYNRELEQFAYVCSHDLKEPLRMIDGYVDLLQKRYGGLFDEKAATYFNYIVKGTKRMEELIQGLLAYARVEDPHKMLSTVNMQKMLDQAIENLAPKIEEINATITADPLPKVKGYDIQLIQLFQNLMANALKFRRDEHPLIHISAERKNNQWRFGVHDNGIGIAPQHGKKIFQIFQRLHSDKEYTGTGIGLSICKKIVQNHGGKIWYKGKPEGGTTFYFTLPETDC